MFHSQQVLPGSLLFLAPKLPSFSPSKMLMNSQVLRIGFHGMMVFFDVFPACFWLVPGRCLVRNQAVKNWSHLIRTWFPTWWFKTYIIHGSIIASHTFLTGWWYKYPSEKYFQYMEKMIQTTSHVLFDVAADSFHTTYCSSFGFTGVGFPQTA